MGRWSKFLKLSNLLPYRQARFWWSLLAVGLGGLFYLARLADPTNLIIYQQLIVLFVLDSILFLATDRVNAKVGVLTLIFMAVMELIVTSFYLITYLVATARI